MNKHQIKQWLQNNLFYGEQKRKKKSRELFAQSVFISPDVSRVWGVDISHWQEIVDLSVAKKNGCSFVIIKACDGALNTKYFIENKNKAKSIGMPWGAYVWLYPNSKVPISSQVAAWWARLKDDYPPLGVYIDAEWTSYAGQPANPTTTDLQMAKLQFYNISGKRAHSKGIYTAAGYANQYLIGFDYSDVDLWVAHYNVNTPQMPRGATGYKFHQFTSQLDGVGMVGTTTNSKEVDGNYYNGTMEQFAAEFGITPPTGEPMKYKGTVITAGLRVRSTPDSTSTANIIGGLVNGDVLEADSVISGWWHIITKNGVAYSGYAYEGDAKGYIRTDVIVADPVPSIFITHDFSDVIVYNGKRYTANYVANNVEYKPEA